MTDQPESAREGGDEILSRIFASDLPEEEKRRLLLILLAKRKSAEQGILAEADQLIAEAEALLKGQ